MMQFCLLIVILLSSTEYLIGAERLKVLSAGTIGVQTPIVGWVSESPDDLRAILGLPGSSHVGQRIPLPDSLMTLNVAPGRGFSIAQSQESKHILLLKFDESKILSSNVLLSATTIFDHVTFSPSTTSAALYSESNETIHVFTGLPYSSRLEWTARFASRGDISSLAVSDDGRHVIVGIASSPSDNVAIFQYGSLIRSLSVGAPSAMLFLPHSSSAIIADRARDEIVLMRLSQEPFSLSVIASGIDDVKEPVGLETSPDGRFVFVLNAQPPFLLKWDPVQRRTDPLNAIVDSEAEPIKKIQRGRDALLLQIGGGWRAALLDSGPIPSESFR